MYQEDRETNAVQEDTPDGPTRNRSCTDLIFFLVMIVFWAGTIAVLCWAFATGNPWLLAQTYDFKNTPCGKPSAGTTDFKFAYFFQPLMGFKKVVCLSQCPTWGPGETGPKAVACYTPDVAYNADINNCVSDGPIEVKDLAAIPSILKDKPFLVYNTSTVMDRFCLPSVAVFTEADKRAADGPVMAAQLSKLNEYVSDVTNSWKYFLIIGAIAIGLSLLILVFMRCCAGVITWLAILLYIGCIFALAIVCGRESARLDALTASLGTIQTNLGMNAGHYWNLMIFLYVFGGISCLIILLMIPTIIVTISVIKSSAQFIYENLSVVLVPIFTAIFVCGYIVLWIAIFLYIFSVGTYKPSDTSPFADVEWSTGVRWVMAFHVITFLWNVAFFNYYSIFTIAGGCAIWYFNSESGDPGYFAHPVATAAWWGMRYHLGSIALGSFILMLLWLVQLMLEYLAHYVKKINSTGVNSSILLYFIRCLQVCVSCFTRVIQFLSELGFAQLAITSKNFCTSCMDAFKLLASNPMRFGSVAFLGSVFTFIGKLIIASACGLIGWALLRWNTGLSTQLYEYYVPVFFFILIGWITGWIFFSVFGTTANTVLLCFLYEKEYSTKTGRPVRAKGGMQEFCAKYKAPPAAE